jgi:hypothetical protein
MVQAVGRRPFTVEARLQTQSSPVGYVMHTVALWQVLLIPRFHSFIHRRR